MIAAVVTLILACIGGVAWLWHIHEAGKINTVKIERNENDIAEVKAEARNLRDGHVRTDTILETMQARLASLDQLPGIAVSVKTIESTVTELKQQVMPREALEARLKALERKQ